MESSTWHKSSHSAVTDQCLEVQWHKSSHSQQGSGNCLETTFKKSSYSSIHNCLEAALPDGTILVRDSKNPNGGILEFSPQSWVNFLGGVRNDEFNLA